MRSFIWTVCGLWIAAGVAGVIYSSQQNIPSRIAGAAIAALLVEAALYLMPGVAAFRERLIMIADPWTQGAWLLGAALIPFLIYSLGSGSFTVKAFAVVTMIAAFLAFWYALVPWRRNPALADLALLTVVAGALLSDAFKVAYPQLAPKANVSILGQLMLIRTYAFALLCIRRHQLSGFGFWPSASDWRVGLRQFAYFVPAGFVLAYSLKFASFRAFDAVRMLPAFVLTFLGILFVVALSEELFFRGVLQAHLERMTGNRWVALIAASVLFGLVHLPFRAYPNWKLAVLAAAAGMFYGSAFRETGSIRSGMVTHALVASVWRVFLV